MIPSIATNSKKENLYRQRLIGANTLIGGLKMKIDNNRFNEALEMMCDKFCQWPVVCASQDELNKHCDECPMNNIECDDYWEERDNG